MNNILPALFCNDDTYFRSCFEVSASECNSVATKATATCLEQYAGQLPPQIKRSDAGAWGEKVGACAGAIFDSTLAKKKISNAKCNDASAWK